MLLRIDDIVSGLKKSGPKQEGPKSGPMAEDGDDAGGEK